MINLETLNQLSKKVDGYMWMIEIFVALVVTVTLYFFTNYFFKKLLQKATTTKNYFDESFVSALHRPIGVLIWLIGTCYAANIAGQLPNSPYIFTYVSAFQKVGVLILITWFAVRLVSKLENNYLKHVATKHKTVDKTLVHALSQLLTIAIIITSVLIGMQLFGLPISGLLAFGGIGGAGVAFASKDLLANFFGGMVIYLDRPFKVGDWVRSPDKNIEGVVEYIGWRVTHIRTFDKRPLYVPNGIFLNISVENASRMFNRRIKTLVGVRYDDASKVSSITTDIKEMLTNHVEIDPTQTLLVNLVEFAPSSLNILVYTFTKTTQWVKFQEVQQDIFLKIMEIVEQHDAQCAFPTSTIHLNQEQQPSSMM